MISFIIPFASRGDNLHEWKDTDGGMIILSTILAIKNINKIVDLSKEIILVDNTNTFPDIAIPNLKIVKGIQYLMGDNLTDELKLKYKIDDVTNHTMWASIAYNIGIEHSKGDYIVLQHNDIFYHKNEFKNLIDSLDYYEYVSADSKHLSLHGYLANKEIIDSLDINIEVGYEMGGYIKQTLFGLADAYFFLCKKEFFNDYSVDWGYGDTNHGATIKCLLEGKPYHHIHPFFGNHNYDTDTSNTYIIGGDSFITHLKGGFSEHKLSFKVENNKYNMGNSLTYLNKLIQEE
jgi:glycosyltransferase involved in cell wall biosynthesis